ncbi:MULTISPECIES: cardiolipin synthase [unclassified Pseudochrobactrum]|uniref:cardiolipin synthase n=1 Tax=unclassified Pseudochrobactrum TaxID=2647013 RepID=UPI0009519477|nr:MULTISPECIES: cardiolipin synthase [unclassified Pseudochrobactrum]UCA45077.1 cardiolipin synthase [Pseudochrobactrum sp. XF203]
MFDALISYWPVYWPHIVLGFSLIIGAIAAIHATMTKEEVRSALGWVGVIMLSPIIGAVVYAIAGVNRIRRTSLSMQRAGMTDIELYHLSHYDASPDEVRDASGNNFIAMKRLGDVVSRCNLTSGNNIEVLQSGDIAYAAMLEAISRAKRSILLETYIFDNDEIGKQFAEALGKAVIRGVEVRVLVDAVGARYSTPSIVGLLRSKTVQAEVFNGKLIMGLRLPYANLRTHRKILIIDGGIAFTGGMNIRAGFTTEFARDHAAQDTHFRLTGPVVTDLFNTASEDWRFTTDEHLSGAAWSVTPPAFSPGEGLLVRAVPSGPDKSLETNHKIMMGAFSVAEKHIRIMTPYLLPDRELVSALVTAARRGVTVDIVVPAQNNLVLVDMAMTAQFDQLLKDGCRIWRAKGAFNHSKLMSVDDVWAYVGSSNLDPRSLRLNFEIDLEVYDAGTAKSISRRIDQHVALGTGVKLADLKARPFSRRLLERIVWLGSPYL